MTAREEYVLARRLASLLLLRDGELGISNIQALPYVDDEATAEAIAHDLRREFGALERARRIPGSVGAWEQTLRLPERAPQETLDLVTAS